MLIYNIKTQFDLGYNPLIFDGVISLLYKLSKLSINGTEHKSQYFYSLFNISAQGPLSKYEKLLNIYILFCNKMAQRQQYLNDIMT